MKKHTTILVVALGTLLVTALIWSRQSTPTPPPIEASSTSHLAPPHEIISAYTYGEISRTSAIQVRFADNVIPTEQVGTDVTEPPFEFSPKINGTAKWKNTRTLEFVPQDFLPSGELYEAKLDLEMVQDSLPQAFGAFKFHFHTRPQRLSVEITSAKVIDPEAFAWQRIEGRIKTLDAESAESIEKIFSARLKRKDLTINWDHQADEYMHAFVIDSVPRSTKQEEVLLAWNGKPAGISVKGEERITISPVGHFKHTETRVFNYPEQYIILEFSDPLAPQQNLKGLVEIGQKQPRFVIAGNQVKVYPKHRLRGAYALKVSPGIKNAAGERLKESQSIAVQFEEDLPKLRWIGKGVIMPRSQKMPLVFESMGIKKVDVRVIKIFEKNIPQFLQVNQLDEHEELKRVGKQVARKTITFDSKLNLESWTRHSLELSQLIEPDPGAIYEVALAFRRSYTFQECEEDETEDRDLLELPKNWDTYTVGSESSGWDYYYYSYDDRENPCHRAFYNKNLVIKRNVLASDLGLIAKQSPDETLITVTDLKTTEALSNVNVEIFDYQLQSIARSTTNEEGQARPAITRKPYLLVAQQGNQRGYLRLDDASALSLSRFDVQGATYEKGVKGYIYGERGVWRPGDEMYLTFMLEDEKKQLPPNHPVQFTLKDPQGQEVYRTVETEGLNGVYAFPVSTEPSAPTGNYQAEVKVGGADFRRTIKVETIVPNRLKLNLDFGVDQLTRQTANLQPELEVKWLHGAIAKNLDAEVGVTLSPTTTKFKTYQDFEFDDPVRKFGSEEMVLFDGKLDDLGKAKIPVKLKTNRAAPGMLMGNFRTKAFEPGGNFSTDRFSIPYHPYEVYAGVKVPKGDAARNMLLTDKDHPIQIVTVDTEGKLVSRNNVKVSLYKLKWRWWFDKSHDDVANYEGKVETEALQSEYIETVNGEGTWNLRVNYPQWGRYLIRVEDESGHATGKVVYIDWPGWAGRAQQGEGGGANLLSFTSDKPAYEVGETVTLNIPTGFEGRAMVSIESGSRVLETYWVDAQKGMTQMQFTTTPEMAPNVYAHITLLQPHAQTQNDLPIRLYGVIPIPVKDPTTYLEPEIRMAEVLEPNAPFKVNVSEATGKPMTYTLAVVDEGLLDLTRFKTPSPHSEFYRREGLTVKTWDLFDKVLGAYGGRNKESLKYRRRCRWRRPGWQQAKPL